MLGMIRLRNPAAAVLAACMLAAAGPVMAADTDLVVLKNGDRMHGEIKGMQYGRLQLLTTAMSTVYVEWDKVAGLTSPRFFEFELMDGSRYYGSLEPADAGTLGVTLEGQTNLLDLARVVRIRPIKSSFWDRIDGSISLGANYTKSSEIGQGSLSVSLARGARRSRSAPISARRLPCSPTSPTSRGRRSASPTLS